MDDVTAVARRPQPVDKRAALRAKVDAMTSTAAALRAYELLHVERELTREEEAELAACLVEPIPPF